MGTDIPLCFQKKAEYKIVPILDSVFLVSGSSASCDRLFGSYPKVATDCKKSVE